MFTVHHTTSVFLFIDLCCFILEIYYVFSSPLSLPRLDVGIRHQRHRPGGILYMNKMSEAPAWLHVLLTGGDETGGGGGGIEKSK